MATGRTAATSSLAPAPAAKAQEPRLLVTATAWFCISSHHQLQTCFGELCWPAPFLKNINSSNFVENGQLTWLIQTWTDCCSSAELFFWVKNSTAGMKAFICQSLSQLKWRTCAIAWWTHAYLHQLKEAWVQNVHVNIAHLPASMWTEGMSTTETEGGIIFPIAM